MKKQTINTRKEAIELLTLMLAQLITMKGEKKVAKRFDEWDTIRQSLRMNAKEIATMKSKAHKLAFR